MAGTIVRRLLDLLTNSLPRIQGVVGLEGKHSHSRWNSGERSPDVLDEIRMSGPRLPPEISDSIVDLLQDEPQALKQCCLVYKPWVPRTRSHLFRRVQFRRSTDVNAWKEAFPNPAKSPACYTHSLSFSCIEVITAMDAEDGSWIRAFSNVVRLEVSNGMRSISIHLHIFLLTRICLHSVCEPFAIEIFNPYLLSTRS